MTEKKNNFTSYSAYFLLTNNIITDQKTLMRIVSLYHPVQLAAHHVATTTGSSNPKAPVNWRRSPGRSSHTWLTSSWGWLWILSC